MFQYRQVLVRLRAGDSVREIARSGLMGRDKLGELRALAQQQGWLDVSAEVPGDEAIAKALGHRYGTVIVDLETRRPIEVLGAREATIVASWLRQHPSVEIVARDRAGVYSEAVRAANPRAQQVADRWHLLTNLREAVERLLGRRAVSLREAARTPGEAR